MTSKINHNINLNIETELSGSVSISTNQININAPTIIFYHHGIFGSKDGIHAKETEKLITNNNIGFFSFDQIGHGKSSGRTRNITVGGAIEITSLMLKKISPEQKIIAVCNSDGFHKIYANINNFLNIKEIIGIGAAADTYTKLIHPLLQDRLIEIGKTTEFNQGENIEVGYPTEKDGIKVEFNKHMFEEAKQHDIITKHNTILSEIKSTLFYGDNDIMVSSTIKQSIANLFNKPTIIYCEDSHDLSKSKNIIKINQEIKNSVIRLS